jgi:hypothetical protein
MELLAQRKIVSQQIIRSAVGFLAKLLSGRRVCDPPLPGAFQSRK